MNAKFFIQSAILVALFTTISLSTKTLAKDLIMGVENIEYYPIYAKREGKYSGYARELFDTFAEKYGHTITYKPLPIKRLFGELLNGRLDLKFPDNAYWASDLKKDKNVSYSTGVLDYIDGVMVLPAQLAKGKDRIKNLGIVRGFTPWDYMGDVKAGTMKTKENNTLDGLVKMMKSERIQGVYFNVAVARYFLKHTLFQENAIIFDPELPHSKSKYHVSSIQHPDVLEQINAFFAEQKEFISQLKTKYEVEL
mgnify:CR=1 FL=1